MQNTVITDPGDFVSVQLIGAQDFGSIKETAVAALPLIDQLRTSGKAVKVLIDISEQTAATPDSNQMSLKVLDTIPYDKMAIYGGTKTLNDITNGIIAASGKAETTQVFETREDAVSWLLAP